MVHTLNKVLVHTLKTLLIKTFYAEIEQIVLLFEPAGNYNYYVPSRLNIKKKRKKKLLKKFNYKKDVEILKFMICQ